MSRNVIILISTLLAQLAIKPLTSQFNAGVKGYVHCLGLVVDGTYPFLLAGSVFHHRIHILRSFRSQYSTWLKFLLLQTYPI
jgi:hypothetical protein